VTKSTTATAAAAAAKKQKKAGSGEYPGRQEERVVLFNGDEYAGGWRFGRRHGSGVYTFASGGVLAIVFDLCHHYAFSHMHLYSQPQF